MSSPLHNEVTVVQLPPVPHTLSELEFEDCIRTHGYQDLERILRIEGQPTPDYKLPFEDTPHFFEVKEFDSAPPSLGYGFFDPYTPVRTKIHKAARQFKNYKGYPCSVVVSNPKPVFQLLNHTTILGAMFGNPGFQIPIDASGAACGEPQNVFLGGGEMIHPHKQKPKNTTISAVITVHPYQLRLSLIRIEKLRLQAELHRALTGDEMYSLCLHFEDTEALRPRRAVVYENPFARKPLSRGLFRGPYDEWWGERQGSMTRVFIGTEAAKIESVLPPGERP